MTSYKKLFVIISGVILTSSAYAFDLSLRFTNDTDKNLRPEATITYSQNGQDYWNVPTDPPGIFIPAHAQSEPADILRTGLDDYFLEYFEIFDENKKMVATCLESYVPINKDAVLTFRLKQIGHDNPHYYCNYTVNYDK